MWHGAGRVDDTDRVRTVVKKLRAKLGDDAAKPTYIVTVHGVGYVWKRGMDATREALPVAWHAPTDDP